MKKILIAIIIFCYHAYAEDLINLEYPSPNSQNIIYYEGLDRDGEGTFYYKVNNNKKNILTKYSRYGPILNWISNNIAEIKIPTGSPNFYAYYYDFKNKKLSRSYNLAIANDGINQNVACLDFKKIIIYDMFSGNIKSEYIIEHLEPIGFLSFCESEYKFLNKNIFYIKWKCPEQDKYKEINIIF